MSRYNNVTNFNPSRDTSRYNNVTNFCHKFQIFGQCFGAEKPTTTDMHQPYFGQIPGRSFGQVMALVSGSKKSLTWKCNWQWSLHMD